MRAQALAEAARARQGRAPRPARRPAGRLMRRLFWLAMGITIGALVVRKLSSRRREADPGRHRRGRSPTGLRDLADAIGEFGADVRAAAAEREAELRAGTGLDAPLPGRRPGRAARPSRRPRRRAA